MGNRRTWTCVQDASQAPLVPGNPGSAFPALTAAALAAPLTLLGRRRCGGWYERRPHGGVLDRDGVPSCPSSIRGEPCAPSFNWVPDWGGRPRILQVRAWQGPSPGPCLPFPWPVQPQPFLGSEYPHTLQTAFGLEDRSGQRRPAPWAASIHRTSMVSLCHQNSAPLLTRHLTPRNGPRQGLGQASSQALVVLETLVIPGGLRRMGHPCQCIGGGVGSPWA